MKSSGRLERHELGGCLDDMRIYQALSYGEKWRVTRLVATGEAPHDPRMAAAAVELAEHYQHKGRGEPTLYRFLAIALVLVGVASQSSRRPTETLW
jgi:hypothetical protein